MFLCPLHDNKHTPAAHLVSEERWHCFVCDKGGDILDLVQEKLNLPLMEAVQVVAGQVGLKITDEAVAGAKKHQELRERTKKMLAQAQVELTDDIRAGMYLEGRGLTPAAIEHFGIGYNAKIDAISIPLLDAFNRTVGYSMRMMDPEAVPKYKNSYEDEYGVFKKKEILYNLGACRAELKKKKVYICEGYFDVMTMWMLGFTETIGICQAIMTKEQAKVLHDAIKPETEIVLVPDLDEPGLDALEKNVTLLRAYSKERVIRVAAVKGWKDVSEKFTKDGPEATTADMHDTVPAEQFLLDRIAGREKDRTKQYMLARPIMEKVTPLMRDDLIEHLAKIWNKDRALLTSYFGGQGQVAAAEEFAGFHDMVDGYSKYVKNLSAKRVRFGIPSIDRLMRGVAPGEVALIQARTSVGKTAVVLNLMGNMSKSKHETLFFSLEQQKEQIFERYVQIANGLTGIEVENMVKNNDPRIHDYFSNAYDVFQNVTVVDRGRMTLPQIREYILQFAAIRQMPQAVVVDYFGYIKAEKGDGDAYEAASNRAKELKNIAKELNNSWFVLHQLSRKGGSGGEPVTSDMGRDSGVVEESADHIIGLWRPELALEISSEEKLKRETESKICWGVTKQRSGPTGQVDLIFDKKSLRIEDGEVAPYAPIASRTQTYLPGQEAGARND